MQEVKNYKKAIFKNSIWQTVSRVVSILVGIFSAMILTRYLGPRGYGEFNSVIVYTSIFAVIADLGVYQILLRELAQKPGQREKIMGNVFVWRALSSFISFTIAAVLGFALPYRDLIKYIIIIESIRSFVYAIRAFYITDFQYKLRMDIASIGDIINRVSFIIFIYLAAHFNLSLFIIFLFIFLATLLDFGFIWASFKKICGGFKYKFEKSYIKDFIKESWPIGVAGLLGMIHFKGDTFLLSIFKPQEDVGIYSASYRIYENLVFLPGIFLGLIFPRLSYFAKNDKYHLKIFFQKIFNIMLFSVIPLTLFFALLAPYVVQVMAGPGFFNSIFPTTVLSIALIAIFMAAPFSQLIIATGKQKTLIVTSLIVMAINIVLNLIFIPKYSYTAASIITLSTEFLLMILLASFAKAQNKFWPKLNILLKLIIPSVILVLIVLVFKKYLPFASFESQRTLIELIEIGALMIVSFAAYFIFSLFFKAFSKNFIKRTLK